MQYNLNSKEKLEPLRRFCIPGLYSTRYLSILVQRKRLKAEKIGRNYFTSRAWFEEYLDKYAADEKKAVYISHIIRQKENRAKLIKKFKNASLEKYTLNELDHIQSLPAARKVNLEKLINIKTVAVSTAIFVFLIFSAFLAPRLFDRPGRVAGEKEEIVDTADTATTTMELIEKMPGK